jgi:cell division protein FtsW (lipid II flippase)
VRQEVLFALPFIPLYLRGVLISWFRSQANDILSEPEHDREAYRTHVLAFVGFAFTALCALAIVDDKLRTGLHWAIYYLLVSFFAFTFSLNWVAYKGRRWEDQLATGLAEIGTLSLFLAVVAVLQATQPGETPIFGMVAATIWCADHVRRFCLDWKYLSTRETKKG